MRKAASRKIAAAIAVIAANLAVLWLWRRGRHGQPVLPTAPPVEPQAATPAARPAVSPGPAKSGATARPAPPLLPIAQRRIMLAQLAGALILAFLGQAIFAEGQYSTALAVGAGLYLAAIVLFSLAARRIDIRPGASGSMAGDGVAISATPTALAASLRGLLQSRSRIVGLAGVLLLTIVLLDLLSVDPPLSDYTLPFVLWLGAIGLYVRTVVPRTARARNTRPSWLKTDWAAALTVLGIVLAAFLLRVWNIEGIPPTLGGDEGTFGLESIKTITGQTRNPFTTGWLSIPTLSFYFNSLTIRAFGQSVFALRLPWALVGTLTVVVVFLFVRRLAGTTLALMTAALLATYHFHIHYSRLGVNNVADPLLIGLALYLLHRAYDRRETLAWVLCGVSVGVAQYFYFGARFAVILIGVMLLYFAARDGLRFLRAHAHGVAAMAGAAIVAGAPMIQYALRYPLDYNARFNQIGIIGPSGWLDREQEVRGESAATILLDQLQRAALAFNVYPDRTGWYGSPEPLFDFTSGLLFLLGLGYATLHPGDRRLFAMVAWWWGATILGGALTESPPSTQRLVTLGPPAVFFVALALLKTGQIVQRAWNAWAPRRLIPYFAVAVVAISLASVKWYFADFIPLHTYGTFNGVVATEMARYMRDRLGPDWRVYFFGPPRIYIEFGTIPYMAPQVGGEDIAEPLTAPLDPGLVQPDKNAAFIFLPERSAEIDFVRQIFPNGTLEEIPSLWEGDPNPFFIVYSVQTQAAN